MSKIMNASVLHFTTALLVVQPMTMVTTALGQVPVESATTTQTASTVATWSRSELTPVERARQDAVERLLAEVRVTELTPEISLGTLIDDLDASARIRDALAQAKQVGGPRYISSDVVQVRLEAAGQLVIDSLAEARSMLAQPPLDETTLVRLVSPLSGRTFAAVGSTAPPIAVRTTASPVLELSSQASSMSWGNQPVTASAITRAAGTSRSSGVMLRTARSAETAARQNLRKTLLDLQLDGTPVRNLPGADQLVDRLVEQAKVFGVDYRDDGSVEVKISIDGSIVLGAIEQTR